MGTSTTCKAELGTFKKMELKFEVQVELHVLQLLELWCWHCSSLLVYEGNYPTCRGGNTAFWISTNER